MKNQLLEDLDDSQSRLPAPPVRRVQAVPPPQPTLAPPLAGARQRAGVWRSRTAIPPPPPPSPPPLHAEPPPRAPEPPEPSYASGRIEPQIASFSSREPDWTIPLAAEEPPWTERWGSKALGWTVGAGLAVAVAATAAWMVRDTQVESTLAVVADHTPAKTSVPVPQIVAAAPADPAPEEPPPLRMLPPEPVVAAPVIAAPPPVEQAAPKAPAKPAAKPGRERRLAAAGVKRDAPVAKKPASKASPKPPRERVLARAPATPVGPAPPAPKVATDPPPAEGTLADTLRLCRAAGYHATACIKRRCEATRFGLVCRG